MRVNYNFKDDFGRYDIVAEVTKTGRVSLIEIRDEYGSEIDMDDFSTEEINQIGFLGRRAAEELDSMPDEKDDTDDWD